MEKDRFLFLATHQTSLTSEETGELKVVQKSFPYCQPLHVLVARGGQINQDPTFQKSLNLAAVYATDRSVLKAILSAPAVERNEATAEQEESEETALPSREHYVLNENLAQEVMSDLVRLKELRHTFEKTVEEYNKGVPHLPSEPRKTAVTKNEASSEIPRAAKAPVAIKETPSPIVAVADLTEDEPQSDALLEEIRGKKKLKPESTKQKEQIEIINQFIKKQPTIPKATPAPAETTDLAEKSISLTDNIVSETLVEILLRQGKKDKAIEVLKKLIWKFPQKKSIFAAQIEELKK